MPRLPSVVLVSMLPGVHLSTRNVFFIFFSWFSFKDNNKYRENTGTKLCIMWKHELQNTEALTAMTEMLEYQVYQWHYANGHHCHISLCPEQFSEKYMLHVQKRSLPNTDRCNNVTITYFQNRFSSMFSPTLIQDIFKQVVVLVSWCSNGGTCLQSL